SARAPTGSWTQRADTNRTVTPAYRPLSDGSPVDVEYFEMYTMRPAPCGSSSTSNVPSSSRRLAEMRGARVQIAANHGRKCNPGAISLPLARSVYFFERGSRSG